MFARLLLHGSKVGILKGIQQFKLPSLYFNDSSIFSLFIATAIQQLLATSLKKYLKVSRITPWGFIFIFQKNHMNIWLVSSQVLLNTHTKFD